MGGSVFQIYLQPKLSVVVVGIYSLDKGAVLRIISTKRSMYTKYG